MKPHTPPTSGGARLHSALGRGQIPPIQAFQTTEQPVAYTVGTDNSGCNRFGHECDDERKSAEISDQCGVFDTGSGTFWPNFRPMRTYASQAATGRSFALLRTTPYGGLYGLFEPYSWPCAESRRRRSGSLWVTPLKGG
jgi:hypothetical protein